MIFSAAAARFYVGDSFPRRGETSHFAMRLYRERLYYRPGELSVSTPGSYGVSVSLVSTPRPFADFQDDAATPALNLANYRRGRGGLERTVVHHEEAFVRSM